MIWILANWSYVTELWKRIWRTDEEKKVAELLVLIKEYKDLWELSGGGWLENFHSPKLLSRYLAVKLKIDRRLEVLGFIMPTEEEKKHERFEAEWYAQLCMLEVIIEEGEDYKNFLNSWRVDVDGKERKLPQGE